MQSSYNILLALSELFQGKNLPVDYVDGAPKGLQSEFIDTNTINNPNGYLQNGFGNVNIHVPKLTGDLHNGKRFRELTDIILPLLDDVTQVTDNGTFHFQIDDDKGTFEDPDRDGMSYYNIRFEFQTL